MTEAAVTSQPGTPPHHSVGELVERLGGICTWRELRRAVHWRSITAALEEGSIVRRGRGIYALSTADDGMVLARRMTAVASHRTAALHWGWKVKTTPALPDVTIPANRKLRKSVRGLATVHWRALASGDVAGGWVTTRVRTVIDCCLDLPFDEALAVFDSALRGGLKKGEVTEAALALGKIQRRRVLDVARVASHRAANPFESALRALAIEAESASFEPQLRIRYDDFSARVDLGDDELQIVIEAESFEFHGDKAALRRDCVRYTELGARGWMVLRFTWEQVMFHGEWVRRMIGMAVRRRRSQLGRAAGPAKTGRVTGRPRMVAVR
jgi:very-short-patch-repair endonuclease